MCYRKEKGKRASLKKKKSEAEKESKADGDGDDLNNSGEIVVCEPVCELVLWKNIELDICKKAQDVFSQTKNDMVMGFDHEHVLT